MMDLPSDDETQKQENFLACPPAGRRKIREEKRMNAAADSRQRDYRKVHGGCQFFYDKNQMFSMLFVATNSYSRVMGVCSGGKVS